MRHLRDQILRAIFGGAVVGAAACGGEDAREDNGDSWQLNNVESNSDSNNANPNNANNTNPNNTTPPSNTDPNNTVVANNTTPPNNVSPNNTTPPNNQGNNSTVVCDEDVEELPYEGWREDAWGWNEERCVASWQLGQVEPAPVRDALEGIADEEGEHAQLAWGFVRWMLEQRPHLIPVARQAFARAGEVPLQSPWASGLEAKEQVALRHGWVPPALEDRLRRRAVHEVVVPCAEALFEALESGATARA